MSKIRLGKYKSISVLGTDRTVKFLEMINNLTVETESSTGRKQSISHLNFRKSCLSPRIKHLFKTTKHLNTILAFDRNLSHLTFALH